MRDACAGGHELHNLSRSQADAASEQVAPPALGAPVGFMGHARRRWVALVRHGCSNSIIRGPAAFSGSRFRRTGGGIGHRAVSESEKGDRPPPPALFPAPLLGHSASSGPILFPFGTYHYGVLGFGDAPQLLSGTHASAVVLRRQHCYLPHS